MDPYHFVLATSIRIESINPNHIVNNSQSLHKICDHNNVNIGYGRITTNETRVDFECNFLVGFELSDTDVFFLVGYVVSIYLNSKIEIIKLILPPLVGNCTKILRRSFLPFKIDLHNDSLIITKFQHLSDKFYRASSNSFKGQNQYNHHFAIGLVFAEALFSTYKCIDLVVGTGSLARGYGDDVSDVDLFIVGKDLEHAMVPFGEVSYLGFAVDIKAIDVSADPPDSWNMIRKWCFSEGVVLFQRSENLCRFVHKEIVLGEEERFDHIQCLVLHLGWTGFQPTQWYKVDIRGYSWPTRFDYWMSRGDYISAHKNIDRSLDYLISLLFLMNRRRYPGAKWKYFLVRELDWLPRNFEGRLERIFELPAIPSSFKDRAEIVQACSEEVFRKLETERLLSSNIYEYVMSCFKCGRGYIDEYR